MLDDVKHFLPVINWQQTLKGDLTFMLLTLKLTLYTNLCNILSNVGGIVNKCPKPQFCKKKTQNKTKHLSSPNKQKKNVSGSDVTCILQRNVLRK